MQNYEQIFQELGIEVPEGKKQDLKRKMDDNYRSKPDYDKAVGKRDEYKQSLESVQSKLDGFKDVDIADLKNQITTLTNQLADEKAGRQADTLRAERAVVLDEFLKDKKFVNSITEGAIRETIMAELEKGNGKSVDKIFDAITKDADGNRISNILVDESETERPRFTQPRKMSPSGNTWTTRSEIMNIRDTTERQNVIAANLNLFRKEQ